MLTHEKCRKVRSNASISRSSLIRNQPSIWNGHVFWSIGYSTRHDEHMATYSRGKVTIRSKMMDKEAMSCWTEMAETCPLV